MANGVDGVYSVVASAPSGSSIGVIEIKNGQIAGNDISGSRYGGSAARNADGSVVLNIAMTTPPGVFHIWSGTTGETFQTRELRLDMPEEAFDQARPYDMPSYGMTVIFRRVPADYSVLAGPDGIRLQIETLTRAESAWQAADSDRG